MNEGTKETKRLSKEELNAIWKEYQKAKDIHLRDRLIESYLHLVKFVVGRIVSGLPQHVKMDDLYSSGVIGLVKAVEKFDPEMKNKFASYAILLIKGGIIDEMRALDWVPRSVHQKANMIADAQHHLQQKLGREPSDEELARYLKITVKELDELLHRVRPAILIPLNAEINDDPESITLAEKISDEKALTSFEIIDKKEFRAQLEEAVLALPEQEKTVLVLYYYENLMLKEIGKMLDVSESRVSQIHTKAVIRLRKRLQGFLTEYANIL
ncbi:FliA/WhiG family RNA polymerase sigma factor [Simkania negevensis]|uniref:FliA/WhiG family RNA polymerase sigma factor n=1 Tax=Simkania negevensis TaxID=83561 RepID=A0ABS3AU57_9BACT|nr:FliA/WhiG family RNA polymerase sigma factor [Simkania negevensis]